MKGRKSRGKGGQERTRGSEGEWREGSGRGGVLVSGTGWGMLCQGSGLTAARLTSCRDTITHSRDHTLLDSKLVCGSRSELYQVTSGGPSSMQSHNDRVDRPEACIYSKRTPAPHAAHHPCMWWGPEQPHTLSPSFHPSPNSPGNSDPFIPPLTPLETLGQNGPHVVYTIMTCI